MAGASCTALRCPTSPTTTHGQHHRHHPAINNASTANVELGVELLSAAGSAHCLALQTDVGAVAAGELHHGHAYRDNLNTVIQAYASKNRHP